MNFSGIVPTHAALHQWRSHPWARVAAAACMLIALLVLAGWITNTPRLAAFLPQWKPMVVNTAIGVLLGALATFLLASPAPNRHWRLIHVLGALMAILAASVVANLAVQTLTGAPLVQTGAPWSMAPSSASALLLIGIALILVCEKRRRNRIAEALVGIAFLIALVKLLAFLYGAAALFDLVWRVNMSPITAACVALIGVALLGTIPDGRLYVVISSPGPGSTFARRLLPIAFIAPVFLGLLRVAAEQQGVITREYGVALMVVWTIIFVTGAIFWGAAHANRWEADRRHELEHQTFLAEASEVLGASLDFKRTLSAVASLAVPRFADWCTITLRSPDGSLETVAVVHQDPGKVEWVHEYQRRFPPKPDDPMGAAAIIRSGKAEFYREIPDQLLDRAVSDPEQRTIIRNLGMRSAMSLPLIASGRTVGVLSLVTAESERRYDEDDLRVAQQLADRCAMAIEHARLFSAAATAEESYRSLFESSPMPMWVFDVGSLQFLAVNHAAIVHYGYSREEFLSMNLRDIRDAKDISLLVKQVAEPGGKLRRAHAARHRLKSGEIIDVEVTSSDLDLFDRPARLALVNDVTARNRADAELRKLTEQLERRVADRTAELATVNRELESFAYSVSHDLRTPLRALDGFSQALLEDNADRLDDTGRNYLRRIRRGSQRMGELIDALLDLSRVSRGQLQRERVYLSGMAQDILEALRERNPERTVSTRVSDGMVATGDPRLLRALLQNLLGNAWKFSAPRPEACIEFTTMHRPDRAHPVFVVRDNGVGFDMAYASKLFGAFQRLHSERDFEGTGVGLATAQRIVHRHGGEIWAESSPPPASGASFFFTLAASS